MIKSAHHGIVKGGKFSPDDTQAFKRAFYAHEGKRVTVSVGAFVKKRSTQQNKYLWGVVYALISDWSGHTVEEVHGLCKAMFCTPVVVCGVPVAGDTKGMTTEQMEEYCTRVRVWASEQGLYVPKPNEVEY